MTSNAYDQAEKLSRRRARSLPAMAVIFLAQQASYLSLYEHVPLTRTVDYVKVSGWILLTLVLLAGLWTGGFWLRSREVRALLNDEVTRANRAAAMSLGFMLAMLSAVALYVIGMFEPIGALLVLHTVTTFGIGAALLRFGMLERRAHRA